MSETSYFWEDYSDEQLLELKLKDLGLKLRGSRVEPFVGRLYLDLQSKGLKFRPHCWISDEWFAADGVPGIALPFFVVNERLAQLEKAMMTEVEGFDGDECIKLLRHEAGHAIDNAYRLRLNKRRQKLFGLSSQPYPSSYAPQADSKQYVVHVNSWYAQSHPDEDWAETFAVWLGSEQWRQDYQNWPALKKLNLLDEIMGVFNGKTPLLKNRQRPGEISKSSLTLREYYQAKAEHLRLASMDTLVTPSFALN
ncbi:MAG: putative zinc-binding metallopeptidase, partial [Pseudomonadota bacterium]